MFNALLERLRVIDQDAGTYIFLDFCRDAIAEFKSVRQSRDETMEFIGVMDCYAEKLEDCLDRIEARRGIRKLFKTLVIPCEMTILDEIFSDRPGGYLGGQVREDLFWRENEYREKYGLPPLDVVELPFERMVS
jgi:hypothetical protein